MPFQLPFKADTQWLLLQPNYPAMTSAAQKVGLSQSIGYFFIFVRYKGGLGWYRFS